MTWIVHYALEGFAVCKTDIVVELAFVANRLSDVVVTSPSTCL